MHEGGTTSSRHLLERCYLSVLLNAVSTVRYPDFSYEHTWDDVTYSRIGDGGERASISFGEGFCVGAARIHGSVRPDLLARPEAMLTSAPEPARQLATVECLEYLYGRFGDHAQPAADFALWSKSDGFQVVGRGVEPTEVIRGHGLLAPHFGTLADMIGVRKDYADISGPQAAWAIGVADALVENGSVRLPLKEWLVVSGQEGGGRDEALELLLSLGVEVVPDAEH